MIAAWRTAAVAAGTAYASLGVLRRRPPGGSRSWARLNYRDRTVWLVAGPAATAGAAAGAVAAGAPPRVWAAVAVAGGLGLYDDLAGATHARGLRGHARALVRGQVTTGMVKLVGLAAIGIVIARERGSPGGRAARLADGALISGTANLVNLLDLRPGRALKALGLVAAPVAASGGGRPTSAAAAVLATGAVLLPGDLAERHMIGDCGANALGTLLGWAVVDKLGPARRTIALAAVVGLTLASERVSFSAVIDRQPALTAIDSWGRLPA